MESIRYVFLAGAIFLLVILITLVALFCFSYVVMEYEKRSITMQEHGSIEEKRESKIINPNESDKLKELQDYMYITGLGILGALLGLAVTWGAYQEFKD